MARATYARAAAVALCAVGAAQTAGALTPLPPCNIEERGMRVSGATNLGWYDSGLVLEDYRNLDTPDGIIGGAGGPVPQLNDFSGFRITDCTTARAVAVHGDTSGQGADKLLATEFLRDRAQREEQLPLRQVRRAAEALYGKDNYSRVVRLRIQNETCACAVFYPGRWK